MRLFAILLILSAFNTSRGSSAQTIKGVSNQQVQPQAKLSGRYFMKGANGAGFDFTDPKTVLWYGDHGIEGLKMRIKWVNAATFILRDKEQDQVNKDCPPRVYVYQVIKNDGKQLILKSLWTGWNDYKDTIEEYVKQ